MYISKKKAAIKTPIKKSPPVTQKHIKIYIFEDIDYSKHSRALTDTN